LRASIFLTIIAFVSLLAAYPSQGSVDRPALTVDISVRVEPPMLKYYINISLGEEARQPLPIPIEGLQIICTAPPDIRLEMVSSSRYIAMIQGRGGLVICASTDIEVANGTLHALVYPITVGGEVGNISTVWLPYYLVNVVSNPSPREVLSSRDSGYILSFGTSDTIYIRGRVFPYPRELAGEAPQQPNNQGGEYGGGLQPGLQILVYVGVASIGWLAGYISSKALPALKLRLSRRDLEREIIDLLSRNPKGMSLSLISKTINAPKSSTWKKLKKLVEDGVVEEFEGPGKGKLYRLRRGGSGGGGM